MSWMFCGEDKQGRPIGYGVVATCDAPGCAARIDRGIAYVCGEMHDGGEHGCGGYFCYEHKPVSRCLACDAKYEKRVCVCGHQHRDHDSRRSAAVCEIEDCPCRLFDEADVRVGA